MNYCSKACYKKDAESHAPLCTAYPNFNEQHRPSGKHFRCIWFPVDAMQPRFVWLKHIGLDDSLTPDRDELEKFIPGTPNGGDAAFDCFREGNRYLSHEIVVYHDLKAKGDNAYMKAMLGKDPGHFSWRGALLAVGFKARILELWSDDEPRRVERRKKEVIPVDLDIVSLPPIQSFLNWRARSIGNYSLAEEAEAVWPKKPTPQKKRGPAKVEDAMVL
jgi:hypothetical protein